MPDFDWRAVEPGGAMASGRLDAASVGAPAVMQFIKTGKLRCIATGTTQRLAQLPEVPTVAEQGFPGFEMTQWYGLLAPAGTPPEVVQRLAEAAFEVSLGITITCTLNGKTAYLAEVEQAGVFGLAGFDEQILDAMLGTQCPNILYPYATAAIGQLIVNGGFPPFPMQPINFDALYGESLRQRAEQIAQQGGAAGLANAEAAGNA